MIISNSLFQSMGKLSDRITETSKTINRGGLKNTTENLFHKLKNSEFQTVKNMEIKGLDTIIEKYQHYGNIFDEMTTQIEEMSKKVIDSIDGGLSQGGIDAIKEEMTSIKDFIGRLTETEVSGTKLFDIQTKMVIGDGMRGIRTFDRSFIQPNGKELTDVIQSIIDRVDGTDGETTGENLVKEVKNLHDFIISKNTEIGAREAGNQGTKRIYENEQLSENEFMGKRYDLQGSINNLNNLSLSYEALMKTVAKISSLSLVNYM